MTEIFSKRVPDEFGLILPRENGIHWLKQGGGFSCTQHSLEGIYIPIGKIRYNLGYPEWCPEGSDFEQKLQDLDLQTIEDRYASQIPQNILDRGHFESSDEFINWVEESEYYGWINLWDDLYRFTYGVYENLDSDPRNRWDSSEELWDQIDKSLNFSYEELGYTEYQDLDLDDYPKPQAAIRPIQIKDGEENGKYSTEWDNLEGEIVFLLCPNAD